MRARSLVLTTSLWIGRRDAQWQPWASLLVYGVKRVEGRPWYTSHRGRLWIASASKKPEPAEVQRVVDDHLAHNRTLCVRARAYCYAHALKHSRAARMLAT